MKIGNAQIIWLTVGRYHAGGTYDTKKYCTVKKVDKKSEKKWKSTKKWGKASDLKKLTKIGFLLFPYLRVGASNAWTGGVDC